MPLYLAAQQITCMYMDGKCREWNALFSNSDLERAARFSGGIRTYDKYAELFQRPRVWIVEFSTPLAAAVVAAPMRKLWPEYNELSKPACCKS